MRKSAGFNTVELMTILSIAGVLSSIAIPSLAGYLHGYRLKTAAREIAFAMHQARFNAVSKKSRYGMFFDEKSIPGNYTIFKDANNNGKFDSDDIIETKNRYLPDMIKLTSNFSRDTVIFAGNGTLVSRGGTVLLENYNKKKYKIVVSTIIGRIRIEKL